jgi:hypothetical protein
MEEQAKPGKLGMTAMKPEVGRTTARRSLGEGKLPSELRAPRKWRTRADPLAEDWPALDVLQVGEPELKAKTQFERLHAEHLKRPGASCGLAAAGPGAAGEEGTRLAHLRAGAAARRRDADRLYSSLGARRERRRRAVPAFSLPSGAAPFAQGVRQALRLRVLMTLRRGPQTAVQAGQGPELALDR